MIDGRQQAVLMALVKDQPRTALEIVQQSNGILSRNTILEVLEEMEEEALVDSASALANRETIRFSITSLGAKKDLGL